MKTSVCMGTYNGAAYIEQQMYSILHQTMPPDEVILCDDGSTDGTVELIRGFIGENELQERWRLYCNQENKGYPGNFYYAMGLCGGDIVFLSDQDDIWDERKLAHMLEVFQNHGEAKAVCCKFGLISAQGTDIHTLMRPTKSGETGTIRRVSIADVFYKCEWPGMVVAYRRTWYAGNVTPEYGIPHDFLVCARAAEEDGFLQLDEELAYHRRHDHNAGGEEHRLARLLNKKRKLQEIEEYIGILNAFRTTRALNTQQGKKALEQKLTYMEGRCQTLKSGKIGRVIGNALGNRKEVRLFTLVCDLVIVKQKE